MVTQNFNINTSLSIIITNRYLWQCIKYILCIIEGKNEAFFSSLLSSENIIGHNNIIIHWKTLFLNNVLKYPWTILQLSPAYENKYNLLLGFLLLTSS